jgi:hypothetical protein
MLSMVRGLVGSVCAPAGTAKMAKKMKANRTKQAIKEICLFTKRPHRKK